MLVSVNSIGGPELVIILAVLALLGLGILVVAGVVFLIVRASGKSRSIPMAPLLPAVDSQAPACPASDRDEVGR